MFDTPKKVPIIEEFRASRRQVSSLGEVIQGQDLEGRPGYVYLDRFFIESRSADWIGTPANEFDFYLVMSNEEYLSNDLAELEAKLYDYAKNEI